MASRNKLTFKKIKKIFVEIGKSIGNFFKNIYKKIMALPKKVKLISLLWIVIAIVIIILIASTSSSKKTLSTYQGYEKVINDAAIKYVNDNGYYSTRENKLKVDLAELKDANLITEKDLPDNTCVGYSLTYYNDEDDIFTSSTYINCKKYTSEDYYEYK